MVRSALGEGAGGGHTRAAAKPAKGKRRYAGSHLCLRFHSRLVRTRCGQPRPAPLASLSKLIDALPIESPPCPAGPVLPGRPFRPASLHLPSAPAHRRRPRFLCAAPRLARLIHSAPPAGGGGPAGTAEAPTTPQRVPGRPAGRTSREIVAVVVKAKYSTRERGVSPSTSTTTTSSQGHCSDSHKMFSPT